MLALILAAFFFLPLPVSRVREIGLVQVSEGHRESVHVAETGILTEVLVHDGQQVERGGRTWPGSATRSSSSSGSRYEKERDAAAAA